MQPLMGIEPLSARDFALKSVDSEGGKTLAAATLSIDLQASEKFAALLEEGSTFNQEAIVTCERLLTRAQASETPTRVRGTECLTSSSIDGASLESSVHQSDEVNLTHQPTRLDCIVGVNPSPIASELETPTAMLLERNLPKQAISSLDLRAGQVIASQDEVREPETLVRMQQVGAASSLESAQPTTRVQTEAPKETTEALVLPTVPEKGTEKPIVSTVLPTPTFQAPHPSVEGSQRVTPAPLQQQPLQPVMVDSMDEFRAGQGGEPQPLHGVETPAQQGAKVFEKGTWSQATPPPSIEDQLLTSRDSLGYSQMVVPQDAVRELGTPVRLQHEVYASPLEAPQPTTRLQAEVSAMPTASAMGDELTAPALEPVTQASRTRADGVAYVMPESLQQVVKPNADVLPKQVPSTGMHLPPVMTNSTVLPQMAGRESGLPSLGAVGGELDAVTLIPHQQFVRAPQGEVTQRDAFVAPQMGVTSSHVAPNPQLTAQDDAVQPMGITPSHAERIFTEVAVGREQVPVLVEMLPQGVSLGRGEADKPLPEGLPQGAHTQHVTASNNPTPLHVQSTLTPVPIDGALSAEMLPQDAQISRAKTPIETHVTVRHELDVRGREVEGASREAVHVIAPMMMPIVLPHLAADMQVQSLATPTPVEQFILAAQAVADALLVSSGFVRGEGQLLVRLRPDVLGGSEIRLVAQAGTLTVVVNPATQDVQTIVEANRTQFEQYLAEKVQSWRISVSVKRGGNDDECV